MILLLNIRYDVLRARKSHHVERPPVGAVPRGLSSREYSPFNHPLLPLLLSQFRLDDLQIAALKGAFLMHQELP